MPEIREITATETYPVRHPVLRAGKSVETCRFDEDDSGSTTHFGLFEHGKLSGVASLFRNSHPGFNEPRQFQLRGMAVLDDYRGRGFGEQLVQTAEEKAMRAAADLIWFNARINAVGFYEKCGYKITGKPFEIGDIGLHFVMFKRM